MRARRSNNWYARYAVQIPVVLSCPGAAAFAQPADGSLSPTTIFAPASTSAKSIFELSLFVLVVAAAIFLVVVSLLVYSVVRFRARLGDEASEPAQVYGSN